MDNIASRTPAEILAGTPINEPGVIYQYRAQPDSIVWLDVVNREVLDALIESNPLAVRKVYTAAPDKQLRKVLQGLVELDNKLVNGAILAQIAQAALDAMPPELNCNS